MCISFSYWHLHWCFLNVVALQGLDLCLVVLPLIVEDCLKLQHYCLDIIGNFHFRFINCNDWTIIFFQFKFSLTILCTVKQSVEELGIYLVLISYRISTQPWGNTLRWPKPIYILLARIQHKVVLLALRTVFAVGFWLPSFLQLKLWARIPLQIGASPPAVFLYLRLNFHKCASVTF